MGKRAPSAKRMNLLYSNDTQGNYPESWYSATAKQLNVFPSLKGTQKYDICIVGAGYTGLSTGILSFLLAKPNKPMRIRVKKMKYPAKIGYGINGLNVLSAK